MAALIKPITSQTIVTHTYCGTKGSQHTHTHNCQFFRLITIITLLTKCIPSPGNTQTDRTARNVDWTGNSLSPKKRASEREHERLCVSQREGEKERMEKLKTLLIRSKEGISVSSLTSELMFELHTSPGCCLLFPIEPFVGKWDCIYSTGQ